MIFYSLFFFVILADNWFCIAATCPVSCKRDERGKLPSKSSGARLEIFATFPSVETFLHKDIYPRHYLPANRLDPKDTCVNDLDNLCKIVFNFPDCKIMRETRDKNATLEICNKLPVFR